MLTKEQQIINEIKKAQNVLVTFSKAQDGDSAASALAIFLFLKKMGKNVEIAAHNFTLTETEEEALVFLPAFKEIKRAITGLQQFVISLNIAKTKVEQVKYLKENGRLKFVIIPKDGTFSTEDVSTEKLDYRYDLIIVLGAQDLESLGKIYEDNTDLFYKTPIINIDHLPGNEEFGQINYTDITAAATSEIVFSLFSNSYREVIDENIATCLLAGIISKTKSFKTSFVSPQSLSIAAQLISMGARREEIVDNLYRSRPLNTLKLWGRVLARLKSSLGGKLVWSTINYLDFIKTETKENNLTEVINELIINIPQAVFIALIYEFIDQEKAKTKILLYTTKNIDLQLLIKELNPRGVKNLVSIILDKPYQEAEIEIIRLLEEKLSKLPI